MPFDELQPDALVEGLLPGQIVKILSVESIGPDAKNTSFRGPDGRL
jgi:hypothetical protein